jgi:thioesterase domain-containing protein
VGGYSGGGIVAFELAHQLTDAGRAPETLVLLDALAPQLMVEAEAAPQQGGRWKKRGLRLVLDAHALSGRGVPPRWVEVYRTNQGFRALRAYRPRPYSGRAVLVRSGAFSAEGSHGWGALVPNGLEVVDVPGGHHSMLMPPNVHAVADALREHLPVAPVATPA